MLQELATSLRAFATFGYALNAEAINTIWAGVFEISTTGPVQPGLGAQHIVQLVWGLALLGGLTAERWNRLTRLASRPTAEAGKQLQAKSVSDGSLADPQERAMWRSAAVVSQTTCLALKCCGTSCRAATSLSHAVQPSSARPARFMRHQKQLVCRAAQRCQASSQAA